MRYALVFCLLIGLHASAENMLANPDFEEVDGQGKPEHWDLFIMPKPGVYGRLDNDSLSGKYSATIHIPERYPEDPANNWSQTIIADLGERRLIITGSLKTEEATEAALWVQCFSKNPPRVLAAATTSTDSPIYGTREWTSVRMEIDAPKGTEFVVLRCVLKGTGSVWFDSLSLEDSGDLSAEDDKDEAEPELEEFDPLTKNNIGTDLLEVNRALSAAVDAMNETNEALRNEIHALQDDLKLIREQLSNLPPPLQTRDVPKPSVTPTDAISPRDTLRPETNDRHEGHPLVPREPRKSHRRRN